MEFDIGDFVKVLDHEGKDLLQGKITHIKYDKDFTRLKINGIYWNSNHVVKLKNSKEDHPFYRNW